MSRLFRSEATAGPRAVALLIVVLLMVSASALARPSHALADEPQTTPVLLIVVGFDDTADADKPTANEASAGGTAAANAGSEPTDEAKDDGGWQTIGDEPAEKTEAGGGAVGTDENATRTSSNVNEGFPIVPYDPDFDWHEKLFGENDSLTSYYLDMSGGAFAFVPASESYDTSVDGGTNHADHADDGVVHVTLDRPHGFWSGANQDIEVAIDFGEVAIEAFRAASPYVDYARYDVNGDHLLTPDELAIALCVAGYDASALDDPSRTDIPLLWPHAGKLSGYGLIEEGSEEIHFDSFIAFAEKLSLDQGAPTTVTQAPLGMLYHELGHNLGLSDLYPLNSNPENGAWGNYAVNMLSLMAVGAWAEAADANAPGGYRYEAAAFDAWSRYMLGWFAPHIVMESGDYQVTSDLSENGYSQLLIPTSDPDEYYLVENRQPEGHDVALATSYANGNPRGGIVVWHIDKRMYRLYGLDNAVNNTDHAPGIMQQCFETADGQYSMDYAHSGPYNPEPFYDRQACEANFNDASIAVKLPLYNDKPAKDSPANRTDSGITLQFPTQSAREMTVHVELPSTKAGTADKAYPLDDQAARNLRTGSDSLGAIACAALMAETSADVTLVDAKSIAGGLPKGTISFADAYGVLPGDCTIACYNLTGAQLVELAEASLEKAAAYHCAASVRDALLEFDFIEHAPTLDSIASSADDVLTFGGMKFDVDWDGKTGSRVTNASIYGAPIDEGASYYVTMTPSVRDSYDIVRNATPNNALLWGTPADALRSFIQHPKWERVVARATRKG